MGRINNNGHTLGFTFVNASTPYIMGGRLPAGDRYCVVRYPNPLEAPVKKEIFMETRTDLWVVFGTLLFRNSGLLLLHYSAKKCQ